MNRILTALAVVVVLAAGCTTAPAEPVDDSLQVEIPSGEVDPADDPIEVHFERREALLERQSAELDALYREWGVGEYFSESKYDRADSKYYSFLDECERTAQTYEALSECPAQADAHEASEAARRAKSEHREAEMLERHDEEIDELDREFEELGGVNINGP